MKIGNFFKTTKQMQIACEYDNVGGFNNGLCWVIKDNKMGFINSNGAIVIPIEYDYYAQNFYKGYVTIRKEGKWGVNQCQSNCVQFFYKILFLIALKDY